MPTSPAAKSIKKSIIERWERRLADWEELGLQQAKLARQVLKDLKSMAKAEEKGRTVLNLVQAEQATGYHRGHIGRLVREGKVANYGRKNAPKVMLEELPTKDSPLRRPTRLVDRDEIVDAVLGRRKAS
jgi:hypothetical protein